MAIIPFIVDKLREEPLDVVGVVREPRRPPAGVRFLAERMRCAVLHFVEIFSQSFFLLTRINDEIPLKIDIYGFSRVLSALQYCGGREFQI